MPLNITKPVEEPRWATDPSDPLLVATPPELKKDEGWLVEKSPVQYWNYLLRWIWYWIEYYRNLTDIGFAEFDAVVHSDPLLGSDATLIAAIARVGAGSKILVIESQTVNLTPIVVNKVLEIVMKPSVAILKGTSATGLSITSSGVRIKGGNITGFNAGGNKGISIDVAATKVMIGEVAFLNNTLDYDDPSFTAVVYGCSFSA